jgi:hypothetical protein
MLVASVKRVKPRDVPAFCFLVFPQISTKVTQTEILTGATVILLVLPDLVDERRSAEAQLT